MNLNECILDFVSRSVVSVSISALYWDLAALQDMLGAIENLDNRKHLITMVKQEMIMYSHHFELLSFH